MTSNNLISGYSAIRALTDFTLKHWVRHLTVVEYNRNGRARTWVSGRVMDGLRPNYVAGIHMLKTTLHVGTTTDLSGFPPRHEMEEVGLQCWYDYAISFEVVADGSIGILHGFARDGRPVDVLVHATR